MAKPKSKRLRGKASRSQRKPRSKNIPLDEQTAIKIGKLESLAPEIQTIKINVSFLQSESRRFSDTNNDLQLRITDLKKYFEERIQTILDNTEDLESRINEMGISTERLSRDFDKFFQDNLPVRKIMMPPPITSELIIYKGEEPVGFQIGIVPGIIEEVLKRARSHVNQKGKSDEEIVGVLTGRVVGNTIVIEEALSGRPSYSGLTEVALDSKNLAEIVDSIMKEGKRQNIVGWYHSHLDLGVFLSDVDVKTQITLQQFSYVIALVVDPIKNDHGFFYVEKDSKMPDGRSKVVRFLKVEESQ